MNLTIALRLKAIASRVEAIAVIQYIMLNHAKSSSRIILSWSLSYDWSFTAANQSSFPKMASKPCDMASALGKERVQYDWLSPFVPRFQ